MIIVSMTIEVDDNFIDDNFIDDNCLQRSMSIFFLICLLFRCFRRHSPSWSRTIKMRSRLPKLVYWRSRCSARPWIPPHSPQNAVRETYRFQYFVLGIYRSQRFLKVLLPALISKYFPFCVLLVFCGLALANSLCFRLFVYHFPLSISMVSWSVYVVCGPS